MKKIDVRTQLEKGFDGQDLTDRVEEINAIILKVVKEKDAGRDKEYEPLKVLCLSDI